MNLAFVSQYFVQIILSSLVFGRLAYIITHLVEFQYNYISTLYVWDLKFNFFGILIGLILSLFIASKKNKEDFWAWFDAVILSLIAMLIFVHIGYFLAGKAYGIPTKLPWGIRFEIKHIPFVSPIHPTQIYSAIVSMFLLAYSVKTRKRIHLSGIVGSKALMIYSLAMLGIDFLHGAPSFYTKIAYGIITSLSFIAYIHSSHKTHINS